MPDEHLILKDGVRILRPHEYNAILRSITKNEHRTMFETLLYIGSRYSEARWLQRNPKAFDGNSILMPSSKPKAVNKSRFIRLNQNGKNTVSYFLALKKQLPSNQTWDENLKRWAKNAKLDPTGICAKTTRKTWETWLMTTYGNTHLIEILLSTGHTEKTALLYYLMFNFSEQDKKDMLFYTQGWI